MENICWIGYENQLNFLNVAINIDLGKDVDLFQNVFDGLQRIIESSYGLVLFNAPSPVGNLELPVLK